MCRRRADNFQGRELAQLRHPELDDEPATGREVASSVAEARDLLGLGEQVGDRVVDEIDERVLARRQSSGHVADDHRDRRLVGLGAQLLDHRTGQLDAGDGHAEAGER
jgi:hypothetical protein